jgi:predicted nucleic acid-binding protein
MGVCTPRCVCAGRSPRARVAALLVAATAVAYDLPVYTRNPGDLQALRALVQVVAV